MTYKTFKPGQKVRTVYGQTRTVSRQVGCMVFVTEECMGHYHPSKLWAI